MCLRIFIGLFCFLSLSLILKGGSQFYEASVYIDYLRSFLSDYDFNLINQVPKEMGWIVSSTYYFPDFHPETQTPFLAFFYFFERLTSHFAHISDKYLLSALSLNFFIIFVSIKLCGELTKEFFGVKDEKMFISLFLSSTLLYFCFFTSTVSDSFSIPVLFYLLLHYKRFQKLNSFSNPLIFGIVLGFFFGLKSIYIPISLYLLIRVICTKKFEQKALVAFGIFIPVLLKAGNSKVKFDSFFMEPNSGARVLFDYSFEHLYRKITIGFFGPDGFFLLNPVLLIGLILTLKMFYDLYKAKKIDSFDTMAFIVWLGVIFLHPIFMLGDFVEDQLPGRATLIALPLLSLGFAHLFNNSTHKNLIRALTGVFVLWNFWVVYNFVIIDFINIDLYYLDKFVTDMRPFDYISFSLGIIEKNLGTYVRELPFIMSFVIMVSLFFSILWMSPLRKKPYYIASFWVIAFSLMSIHNIIFGPINARAMKEANQFEQKVVAKGADIFLYDYLLDRFNSIDYETQGKLKEELDKRASIYFDRIRTQVIQSTPEFDSKMSQKDWKSSFFQIKKEGKPLR